MSTATSPAARRRSPRPCASVLRSSAAARSTCDRLPGARPVVVVGRAAVEGETGLAAGVRGDPVQERGVVPAPDQVEGARLAVFTAVIWTRISWFSAPRYPPALARLAGSGGSAVPCQVASSRDSERQLQGGRVEDEPAGGPGVLVVGQRFDAQVLCLVGRALDVLEQPMVRAAAVGAAERGFAQRGVLDRGDVAFLDEPGRRARAGRSADGRDPVRVGGWSSQSGWCCRGCGRRARPAARRRTSCPAPMVKSRPGRGPMIA